MTRTSRRVESRLGNHRSVHSGARLRPSARGGLSVQESDGWVFAHELGHNMGLRQERYQVHQHQGGVGRHPAYGYVNEHAFEPGAPASSRWAALMAYGTQRADAGLAVRKLDRFSAGTPTGAS